MPLRGHNIATAPVEPTIRFLIVTCTPCTFTFPADWIRGILTRQEAGSADTVSAAGVTYPLTSLAQRFRLPLYPDSTDTRLILCGKKGHAQAFPVDKVIELIDLDRRDVRALPAQFRGQERIRLSGYFLYHDTVALIVNPLWLLDIKDSMEAFQPRITGRQDDLQSSRYGPAQLVPAGEPSIEQPT
jgi:hypothetical protein